MLADARVAVRPAGAPVTVRATAALSDAPAVEVIVVCAVCPARTLTDVAEALSARVVAVADPSVQ